MKIIYWNVYVNHDPKAVKSAIVLMINQHRPEFFALGEAKNQYDVLHHIEGYYPLQLIPGKGAGDEEGDTAFLVRKDIKLDRHWIIRMLESWRGPKAGIPHDPRVYQALKVKYNGTAWKISAGHWPFGKAKTETMNRIRKFFMSSDINTCLVHVGDLNTSAVDTGKFAKSINAKTIGFGIDRAIFKNCIAQAPMNLGHHGSDHPAILYRFHKG